MQWMLSVLPRQSAQLKHAIPCKNYVKGDHEMQAVFYIVCCCIVQNEYINDTKYAEEIYRITAYFVAHK